MKRKQGNAIRSLNLYWDEEMGCWVFDDKKEGIEREPFVAGMSEMITAMVGNVTACTVQFSKTAVPGFRRLSRITKSRRGAWYREQETGLTGWLCPVVRTYLRTPPKAIYFSFRS